MWDFAGTTPQAGRTAWARGLKTFGVCPEHSLGVLPPSLLQPHTPPGAPLGAGWGAAGGSPRSLGVRADTLMRTGHTPRAPAATCSHLQPPPP